MLVSASISSIAGFLLICVVPSIAGDGPAHPQLCHERRNMEKRSFFGSLGSMFSKRDECGTQFGPTYVDCGYDGCYQPSLGEICCGSVSDYCLVGQYCVGLNCCPNGLTPSCCGTGFGCPANVSDYYSSTLSTPSSPGTTSLPISITTSIKASTTSPKILTSTAAVVATSSLSTTSAPVTAKSTSSLVLKSASGVVTTGTSSGVSSVKPSGVVSTSVVASGAQEKTMKMGIESVAAAVLGLVGFVAGLL